MRQKGFAQILIIPIIIGIVAVFFAGYFLKGNIITKQTGSAQPSSTPSTQSTSQSDQATESTTKPTNQEEPFCKQYGNVGLKFSDLLEEYSIGPGETMRDIARKKLNDESKASELISVNPQLSIYEIDQELPMRMKIYIPNEKYSGENITAYFKSRGNISFNQTKPMFGINAPNSGTGPFIISDNIKDSIKEFKNGDCVEIIYGTSAYDPQKTVFEIKKQ